MKKIVRYMIHTVATVMLFVGAGMLTACINDNSDCPDVEKRPADKIHIRFTIATNTSGRTRAADIAGEQEGTAAENILNVEDMKYLLFDKNQNFLLDVSGETEIVAANEKFTVYNVSAHLTDDYFLENINGLVDFYILVLANMSDWGITAPSLERGDNIDKLFGNGYVMTNLPETYKLMNASTDTENKQYFPMSGLQRFRVQGSMLMTSAEGAPYDLSLASGNDVNLLRSLAKIEIIDKINVNDNEVFDETVDNTGENSWLRIDKVEIDGYFSQGALLPSRNQWDCRDVFETQQVTDPTVPATAEYMIPPVLNADNSFGSSVGYQNYILNFEKDALAQAQRVDKCPVYSCYLFEYNRRADEILGIPTTQLPYFRVTTRGYIGEGGEVYESMIHPIRMVNYTDGVAGAPLDNLLRNNIYRFEIAGIGQNLKVNWTVCPMDEVGIDIPPFN